MKLAAPIIALALSGCTAAFPYPGELPANIDMSVIELNIASPTQVAEECAKMGLLPIIFAGCTCYTGDLKPRTPQHGPAACFIPMGKTAVIWAVDDPDTIKHELAHAVFGKWH